MKDRALAVLVVAVCTVGAVGVGVHQLTGPAAREPGDGAVRVATWNVHQWYNGHLDGGYGLEQVRDRLRQVDADVVALQESEGARVTSGHLDGTAWLARELGMEEVRGPPASVQTYGIALLVRGRATDVHWSLLPADGTIERAMLQATLPTSRGPVDVIVTHLEIEPHADVRARQAEVLLGAMDPDRPTILVGDLNTPARQEDRAYAALSANLTDAWIAAGNDPDRGATSPVPGPTVRIDHIWLAPQDADWQVERAWTFGSVDASDHLGVAADIVLP